MRWLSSLMIYLVLILVLVCALFVINFGYRDSSLYSIFGLGPTSFKTKSSDFWFAMFTESIIVFVTFLVVILFIKKGEEKDRKPVYKEACDDAYHIYDEIYKLIYHIMAYRMKMEMLEPYKKWLNSCGSMKNKIITHEIIKSFFEDVREKDILVTRKELGSRIDYIYSEAENYLQRFGAFLTSEATGNEGSELQKYINNIRIFSRKLKRSSDSKQIGEFIKIQICKSGQGYAVCLGSDSEVIDVPPTIIKAMDGSHLELKKFVEKSGIVKKPEWIASKCKEKQTDEENWISDGKWIHEWSDDGINTTVNFGFLTIGYLVDKLDGVDSGSINRDDYILTWAVLFEKFKRSCDKLDTPEAALAAFKNAEFDFWCMYWDYRHRLLEDAKTKHKRNHLIYKIPENQKNTQNGPKDFAETIRKERMRQYDRTADDQTQGGNQDTVELEEIFKMPDVFCNNDEKAIHVFKRMKGGCRSRIDTKKTS